MAFLIFDFDFLLCKYGIREEYIERGREEWRNEDEKPMGTRKVETVHTTMIARDLLSFACGQMT